MKIIAGMLLCCLSVGAFSETFFVKSVGIDAEENLVFVVFDKASTISTCSKNRAEFKWNLDQGYSYAIYSLALHAHKENLQVDTGTSDVCIDDQPTARWIKLH